MSHFNCLVVGEDVAALLAPYHEFECTGRNDQYVQDIDQTEEARAKYESGQERRLKDPDGKLHDPYDERFYREPTEDEREIIAPFWGTGFRVGRAGETGLSYTSRKWADTGVYSTRVHLIPEGWEDVQIGAATVQTFEQWATVYYDRKKTLPAGATPDLDYIHSTATSRSMMRAK